MTVTMTVTVVCYMKNKIHAGPPLVARIKPIQISKERNHLWVQSQLFNNYKKQVTFILDLRYVDLGGSGSLEDLGGMQGMGGTRSQGGPGG